MQIWLYRRPLLDFWCEGEDSLGAVVTHVLVHEIGHHFGLSDADMEAATEQGLLIDSNKLASEAAKPLRVRGFSAPSQARHAACRLLGQSDRSADSG